MVIRPSWGRWFGFRVWENKRSRGGSNNLPYMLKFFEGIIITKLDVALLIMSLNFVSLDIHTLDGQNDTPVGRIQHHLMHEIFGIYIYAHICNLVFQPYQLIYQLARFGSSTSLIISMWLRSSTVPKSLWNFFATSRPKPSHVAAGGGNHYEHDFF